MSFFLILVSSLSLWAKDINTNELTMTDAPKWLKRTRVEKITNKIQRKLEWTTRKVPVYWYYDQAAFEKAHSLGSTPSAVSKKSKKGQSIHLGPKVSDKNFDQIFGHELVHIIFYQKYHGAIPKWLEEGFANHLSMSTPPDYKWLSKQNIPKIVTNGDHPYSGSYDEIMLHYKISQALVEMLDRKCDLENLLRLSVERKMENYIKTFCEISDVNVAFHQWVKDKAAGKIKRKRY